MIRWGVRGVAVAVWLLTTACTGGGAPQPTDAAASPSPAGPTGIGPTTTDVGLYDDFPECDPLPDPGPSAPPGEMVVPDGMVVTEVTESGPLTTAAGLVAATPLELRDAFAARDDVELVYLEDEGYEAEILVDSGEWRTFVKATIRCRTGSVVGLILAPDEAVDSLPVPGQGG